MPTTNAARLLQTLAARGIPHLLANAGTDFPPLIEALVAMRDAGEAIPAVSAVAHENLAVAMAHGYYAVRGRPIAVMVHTTVGSANAMMGLQNAWRDNIPLLLLAGRTPVMQQGHVAARNMHIHWGQESFDQGAMLREFVKWDYELRAGQSIDEVLGRAVDIAMEHPRGPVYLTLPREVLADPAVDAPSIRFERSPPPPAPAAAAIGHLAGLLAAARQPLIVTSHLGQDPDAVPLLERLTEDYAIPVAEMIPRYVNIAAGHPMNLGAAPREWIQSADVIVVLDCEMPWLPGRGEPNEAARIVHLGLDPLYARYPYRAFTADAIIRGWPAACLQMLHEALAAEDCNRDDQQSRRASVAAFKAQRQKERSEVFAQARDAQPIAPAWLAACLRSALPDDAIVFNELGVPSQLLDFEQPGTFFNAGMAGGLGSAMGAALGAKLAQPERTVAAVVGNGSYMFGNPTPFHHTAKVMELPVLAVIQNNARWQAVYEATRSVYPSGRAVGADQMPLVDLGASPEFELVARASGAHAETVTEPDRLPAALHQALEAVDTGRQALLDVRTGVGGPRQA